MGANFLVLTGKKGIKNTVHIDLAILIPLLKTFTTYKYQVIIFRN